MTNLLILSAVTAGVFLVVYSFMKTQDSLASYHRSRTTARTYGSLKSHRLTRIVGTSVRLKT